MSFSISNNEDIAFLESFIIEVMPKGTGRRWVRNLSNSYDVLACMWVCSTWGTQSHQGYAWQSFEGHALLRMEFRAISMLVMYSIT